MKKIVSNVSKRYAKSVPEELSLEEYVSRLKKDPSIADTAAQRLVRAIGPAIHVDTSKDPRLARIYGARVLKTYEAFKDFHGIYDVVERLVEFFTCAAQGLEEKHQICYLNGPVGSAKSSIAIRLRELMESQAIYVIKGSPVQDSPLCLFDKSDAEDLGILPSNLSVPPSPWVNQMLEEFNGDISKFTVQKTYPNEAKQIAIAVAAAGDPNTQDISTLVGKVDIRKLENYPANHPFAYSYSGALCKANQGILEFVEMFKADVKLLNPLLTATQEGSYVGTENIGLLPFDGIILAHSNESEWNEFASNPKNEAILDRTSVINLPYVLSVDEEVKIYKKKISSGQLKNAPCAPFTLEALALFSVFTRIVLDDKSMNNSIGKIRAYNGEAVKEKYGITKPVTALKQMCENREGYSGMSTRDAFKVLSKTFNYNIDEIGANPHDLILVLKEFIQSSSHDEESKIIYLDFLDSFLSEELYERLSRDIQMSFLGSGMDELGQNKFERYILLASHWLEDSDFQDHHSGRVYDRELLNQELEALEKPAQITNHKDFRADIVRTALQYQAANKGQLPSWRSYYKIREVLEKSLFNQIQDLLPILSVSGQGSEDNKNKHRSFVSAMKSKGYTEKQIKILQDWFVTYQRSK